MNAPNVGEDSLPLSADKRIDAVCVRFEAAWKAGERPLLEDYLTGSDEPEREVLLRELLRLEVEYRERAGENPAAADYRQRLPGHEGLLEALFGTAVDADSKADPPAQRPGSGADADRNLLFAVLALQADLLDAKRFVQACTLWAAQKDRPLAALLVEEGWLSAEDCADVERLLARKLKRHGGDVHASLAEVAGAAAREALAAVADPEVERSIAGLVKVPKQEDTTAPAVECAGRNLLYEMLGEGGMGVVRRGRDPDLGRDLAVKLLRPEYRDDAGLRCRFVEEAQVGGQLQHPGTVPVYEMGNTSDGCPYFSMKLVKGQTLATLLAHRSSPAYELPRFLNIFEAVCQAVAYAHSKGVIHRDLKPGNIMVGAFGEVQVMDWGLAKVLRGDSEDAERTTPGTVVRTVRSDSTAEGDWTHGAVGTLAFMAPEQARGEQDAVDERADVFGMGAVLCVILTGQPPYIGVSRKDLERRVAAGEVGEALGRLEGCGAEEELVVLASDCLAPRREERPRHAGEVARRMSAYLAGVQERLRAAELERAAAAARAEEAQARVAAETLAREEAQARADEAKKREEAETRARAAAEAQAGEALAKAVAERRARRLTMGLAAAVMVVLVMGTAGAVYRHEQRRSARQQAEAGLDLAAKLREAYRFTDAEAMLEQVSGWATQAADRPLQKALERAKDDLELARDLDGVRQKAATMVEGEWDPGRVVREQFPEVLAQHGLDVLEGDLDELAQKVQVSAVRQSIIEALDDWARRETDRQRKHRLLKLANLAEEGGEESNPWRQEVRQALAREDSKRLLPLMLGTKQGKLTAGVVLLLADALGEKTEEATVLLRQLQREQPRDFWVNFILGNHLREAKRHQEATECYLVAVVLRPDSAPARNNLGLALLSRGKAEEAIECYRQALALNPKFAAAHTNLGAALHDKGKEEEAIACWRKAISLDPKFSLAHNNLGIALSGKGKAEEAIACFRQAILFDPKLALAHGNLGVALHTRGKVDQAIPCFRQAIALDPKLPGAHFGLGIALKAKGEVEEAIACFRQAIVLDCKRASAHHLLGLTLAAKGELDEAIACFRQATGLEPKNPTAHDNLGVVLGNKGNVGEAIESFNKAIALDPKYAPAYFNLGNTLLGKRKVDEAITCFRKAIHIFPKLSLAHSHLGNALQVKGKQDEALACYRQAIALDSKNTQAHNNLGNVLYAKGEVEAAIACFRKAIALDPKNAQAFYNLGSVFYARGKVEEAIACFCKAIALDPKYIKAHYNLGNALKIKGKLEEAIAAYREAIRLDKDHAELHCNLGSALRSRGEYQESLTAYRRGHQLGLKRPDWPYPSAAWVRQAERLVEMDRKFTAFLKDKATPPGPPEQIQFAQWCGIKKLYATSALLYRDAFARQPQLADAHRYNAACAAALAGTAQGKGTANLDDTTQAELRYCALCWLQDHLGAGARYLTGDQAGSAGQMRRVLLHWQKDADLTTVRDPAALGKLPEAEQVAWRNLWAQVDALLVRTRPSR